MRTVKNKWLWVSYALMALWTVFTLAWVGGIATLVVLAIRWLLINTK